MTHIVPLHAIVIADGTRTTVSVTGELDIDTAPELRQALDAALSDGATRIEVDFSGVEFCDCSGLSVLIQARRRSREQGCAFRIVEVRSPLVRRLFLTTGTLATLTGSATG
ncbi:STAS domain-containing protein [Streptomyces sp. ISL-10]|uniref:STAS domain-containing protein n=1 Tax=Streptomyces sp. ISL-10 TaxID=2819172 RepID=UPI001BE93614|nr:STAS domain-containing protein [Streptomyces sp. ISL-10]MBT2365532.1 STAS domain-containing protein [Streptomyces sp. ISL-10]